MLGDLISEEKGKITSQRVLDVEGEEPKIETSFSATGNYIVLIVIPLFLRQSVFEDGYLAISLMWKIYDYTKWVLQPNFLPKNKKNYSRIIRGNKQTQYERVNKINLPLTSLSLCK